jgi:hypothetical protein
MTHSTVETVPASAGSEDAVYHTIDVTSLDSAGVETYDPAAEVGIAGADRYGVSVRGQEDETLALVWDHVDGELKAKNRDDGTDVANNTDIGEVILEVVGE